MFDYPGSEELAPLVERFDRDGKVVADICHGLAGLVSAKQPDGTPFVAGRKVAVLTDSEERAVGLDEAMPFLLEARLKQLGAAREGGPDFKPLCRARRTTGHWAESGIGDSGTGNGSAQRDGDRAIPSHHDPARSH